MLNWFTNTLTPFTLTKLQPPRLNCAEVRICRYVFMSIGLWSVRLRGSNVIKKKKERGKKKKKHADSRIAPCFLPVCPQSSLHSSGRWLATLGTATGSVRRGHRPSACTYTHTRAGHRQTEPLWPSSWHHDDQPVSAVSCLFSLWPSSEVWLLFCTAIH